MSPESNIFGRKKHLKLSGKKILEVKNLGRKIDINWQRTKVELVVEKEQTNSGLYNKGLPSSFFQQRNE
jgi:hypothetical protein